MLSSVRGNGSFGRMTTCRRFVDPGPRPQQSGPRALRGPGEFVPVQLAASVDDRFEGRQCLEQPIRGGPSRGREGGGIAPRSRAATSGRQRPDSRCATRSVALRASHRLRSRGGGGAARSFGQRDPRQGATRKFGAQGALAVSVHGSERTARKRARLSQHVYGRAREKAHIHNGPNTPRRPGARPDRSAERVTYAHLNRVLTSRPRFRATALEPVCSGERAPRSCRGTAASAQRGLREP